MRRNPIPPQEDRPDVTHTIEPVNEAYSVGNVVRDLSQQYLGEAPNKATPQNLVTLLEELDALTDQVRRDGQEEWEKPLYGFLGDDSNVQRFKRDLARWRMRLDYYLDRARTAEAANPTDRKAILWTVTAPLFLGFYGGPTGTEIYLPGHDSEPHTVSGWGDVTSGFPPGFDPRIKHVADLATPFSLANQIKTYNEHQIKIVGQLVDDIIANAKEIGKTIVFPDRNPYLKYGLIGLGAIAGLYIFTKLP